MKDIAEKLDEVTQDELSGKLTRDEAIMKRDRIQQEFYTRIHGVLDNPEPYQLDLFNKK